MTNSEYRTAAALRLKASHAALALLAAASMWGTAAAVQAGDSPPVNKEAQTTSSKPAKPDLEEKVICRDVEETGTLLGRGRVCHTQREWKRIAQDGQDWLNSSYGQTANPKGN